MKKFVITLVIMFAFMMTSCGQNDVASADNQSNLQFSFNDATLSEKPSSKDKPSHLNEKNRAKFIENYKEKAKSISQNKLGDAKIFALKKGYDFNGKFYWAVITKKESLKLYFFTSNKDFSNVTHEEVDKSSNLREYILMKSK